MPSNQVPDSEILALYGDPSTRERGFELLVRTYQERLYWHIRNLVHFHEDADDVIQNVFVKVWHKLDQFRGESQLYTWLYRIATNEALSHLNQQKRRQSVSIDHEDYNLTEQLKADPYFDGDDADAYLQEAISHLPDKQKEVFLLRYYEGIKYEDMSEMLATSVGALKASYHHAVKKIETFVTGRLNQVHE